MVLDFRTLYKKTVGDSYPLPNIVDIIDQLRGKKYICLRISSNKNPPGRCAQNRIFNTLRTIRIRKNAIWAEECTCQLPKDNGYRINWISGY